MIDYALPYLHTKSLQRHGAAHYAVEILIWRFLGTSSSAERLAHESGSSNTRLQRSLGFVFLSGSCARKTFDYEEARFAGESVFFSFLLQRYYGQLGFCSRKHLRVPLLQRA
jgi:hypothetical protein